MGETVGIVMPAYNSQRYIAEAIQSVLAQDYRDWELWVADDGSGDDTRKIVRAFARRDSRIHWLKSPQGHTGVCGARARGIEAARTPWIAFLDSDDVWHPDKLGVQLETAGQEKSGFLFTAAGFLDAEGRELAYVQGVPERIGYSELLKGNGIPCSSVLIRRELLEDCFQPRDVGLCEDYAAWLRILRDRVPCAVGIGKPLLKRRLVPGSESSCKLRNALRALKTYRSQNFSAGKALWFWGHYAWRGLVKYGRIVRYGYPGENSTGSELPVSDAV